MRILSIDLGSKTMGIAITDSLKIIATGLENFEYTNNDLNLCLKKVEQIILNYNSEIEKIIIGYPLYKSGAKSESSIRSETFLKLLRNKIKNVKIELYDESYSTKEATSRMKALNIKTSKIKKVIDKMAAVIILENYLYENN